MIKLISISFSGIGRFIDKQDIDFSSKEKLLQIDGINENTGGSSGAGKSTIFHALDYALGIGDIPSTTLQSRLTKNPLTVCAELEIDGKRVTLTRSKKDGLTICVDGEVTSGSVKVAEEQLEMLIGIPKKIFKKMIHKKQKEGGFFLGLTAKESYDFLTKALGLNNLNDKTCLIEQDIKRNKESLIALERHKLVTESNFENNKRDLEMLVTVAKPSQVYIEEVEFNLQNSSRSMAELESILEDTIKNAEARKPIKRHADSNKLEELVRKLESDKEKLEDSRGKALSLIQDRKAIIIAEIKTLEAKLGKVPLIKNQITKLAQEMRHLMEEKSHIEKSECPTCKQSWVGNSAKGKLDSIFNRIESIKMEIIHSKEQVDAEPILIARLKTLNADALDLESEGKAVDNSFITKISNTVSEISNTKNKITSFQKEADNQYAQELNNFKIASLTATQEINEKIAQKRAENFSLKSELDSLKSQLSLYEVSAQAKSILQNKLSINSAELQKISEEISNCHKSILIAEESKRLIKSYSLQRFQETLDSIGETASEILRNVPNMSTSSIYFEGCKETNSGSIKEEVTAFINADGELDIDIKSLSGGERTSVDLAVDLAVIDVLEAKAGKGADFFILDEPFDGLDSISRSAVVEILKGIDTNKRIVIVDHGSETKEIISDKITVVRNGETSCVV